MQKSLVFKLKSKKYSAALIVSAVKIKNNNFSYKRGLYARTI